MSTRMLAALAVGCLMVIAGCSDGGDGAKSAASPTSAESSQSDASSDSGPRHTEFADFPGKDIVTTEPGLDLGVRVKPVDSARTPELIGKPADTGFQYIAVYVAVTGELPDRGVEGAKLRYLRLKYKSTQDPCDLGESGYCYAEAYPSSQLEEVADGEWRTFTWSEDSLGTGTSIEQGATMIGVVGFKMSDAEKATSFELCGPTKEAEVDTDEFTCVPIGTPARA